MKIFKKLLIILAGLLLVLLIITFFLPSKFKISRTTDIKAPINVVFTQVNDLHNWANWLPWFQLDKNQKLEFNGSPSGLGSVCEWKSDNNEVGKGKMTIIESKPFSSITVAMLFNYEREASIPWTFKQKGDIVEVTESFESELGFFSRWFGLLMNSMVKSMFEKSLANLKNISEKLSTPHVECTTTTVESMTILSIKDSTTNNSSDIGQALGRAYREIYAYLEKNNIDMTGMPMVINHEVSRRGYIFEAGVPIKPAKINPDGRIKVNSTPSGRVVKALAKGPYELAYLNYQIIMKYIADNKLKVKGASWEIFINDPTTVKPEQILTEIYMPVE